MPASIAPPAQMTNGAPPVLTTSLYAKNATGGLDEAGLQTILSSPIDLELPARVGVVPLEKPFDPSEPVALSTRLVASSDLASSLVGAQWFSQVSDVSTDLPNVGGIEGLRVIAARYRVRYLLLFSQRFEEASHLNNWAWLYPTVIGFFVAPGVTLESAGIAQADMIDVRTGTVLFSVVEPMHVSVKEQVIGASRGLEEAQAEESRAAAKRLAKKVVMQTNALVAFADQSAKSANPRLRIVPAPIETTNAPGQP
jgi:rhombotail lipoprotein